MGKKPKEKNDDIDEINDTDTDTDTDTENPTSTKIVKAKENKLSLLGKDDPVFLARYGATLQRVINEFPTKEDFERIITALPQIQKDAVLKIIRKFLGTKKGVYTTQGALDFPELRLYQGTGNDKNRPKKQIPGEFYITNPSMNVGEMFEGTVLAIWSGRTMWGGEGESAILCTSMDRIIGTQLGYCDKCLNMPWRDNKKTQKCGDHVIAYMLTKDLSNILTVRFQKTSEASGRRLMRLAQSSEFLGEQTYKLTAEHRTGKTDSSYKWYVVNVEAGEPNVPIVVEFCDAMCTLLEGTYILPNMAACYQKGQEVAPVPTTPQRELGEAEKDIDDMNDAPPV